MLSGDNNDTSRDCGRDVVASPGIYENGWLVGVEFSAPLDTTEVISEAVFTANHLTDTDKQNSTGKYRYRNSIQIRKSKQPKIQQNKTTPVQLPLTTLGQETRWAYSTLLPSLHENGWMVPMLYVKPAPDVDILFTIVTVYLSVFFSHSCCLPVSGEIKLYIFCWQPDGRGNET